MAFNFKWSEFPIEFKTKAKDLLNTALNKGPRPDVVADTIVVKELNFGTIAPDLEMLEIGDLSETNFRGILKLTYSGDAFIEIKTKVQANPVKVKNEVSIQARRGILAAHEPLIVPMLLRISDLNIRGIISLSLSRSSGITLVFKNDPLLGVSVSSSFDELESIKSFLQSLIEEKLRKALTEDLPKLLYSLSDRILKKDQPEPSQSSASMPASPPTPMFSPHSMERTKSPVFYNDVKLDSTALLDRLNRAHSESISSRDPTFISQPSRTPSHHQLHSLSGIRSPTHHPRRNFSLDQLPGMSSFFSTSSITGGLLHTPQHSIFNEKCEDKSSFLSPPLLSPGLSSKIDHTPEVRVFSRIGHASFNIVKSPPSHGLKDLLDQNE